MSHARATDPPTAVDAARRLDRVRLDSQVADVVTVVVRRVTAICAEVTADLGRDRGCVSRRLTDAHRRGLIRPDGTRTAPSGREQIRWRPTAKGLSLAARRAATEARRSA